MKSKLFVGTTFTVLCALALLPAHQAVAQNQDRSAFYNYASASNGAKVVAVSHADSLVRAQYLLDGTEATALTFDPADPNPTVVIDLGTRRVVNRVACAFEAPAGQLDFYLVDNAYSKDDAQPLNLSYITPPGVQPVANAETLNYSADTILGNHKPVGSVATTGENGVNHASVNLTGQQGRFLVAAFHRGARHRSGDFKDADFKDTDFKDFKDKNVAIADNPVKVEGISAFGEPPGSQSIPLVPPQTAVARQPVSP